MKVTFWKKVNYAEERSYCKQDCTEKHLPKSMFPKIHQKCTVHHPLWHLLRFHKKLTVRHIVLYTPPSWSPNSTDLYFWYSFVDDQHRNTNMNDKDHLVGQLTRKKEDGTVLKISWYWSRNGNVVKCTFLLLVWY